MRIQLVIFLVVTAFGCTEKWTDEQREEMSGIAKELANKVERHTELLQSHLAHQTEESGSRVADVKVLEESRKLIEMVLHQYDSADIWAKINVSPRTYQYLETKEILGEPVGKQGIIKKALIANEIANYYGGMVGVNCGFDLPIIRLWRSTKDPNQFRVGVGAEHEYHFIGLTKIGDQSYEAVDRFLVKTVHQLEWELIFEQPVSWN